MKKVDIIAEIGEEALLLPARVNEALLANERAKYCIALLQAAAAAADEPGPVPPTLQAEREAAGIDAEAFDRCTQEAAGGVDGLYRIPCLRELITHLRTALDEMIAPLLLCGHACADEAQGRLAALTDRLPEGANGEISGAAVRGIAAADREAGDSLHLLVMDLHRALNELQAGLAEEEIDGAAAYYLTGRDRALVKAFMAGLNRTAGLKFDHPGLGTTATRCAERLLIQNDIGVTEAHVFVIAIAGRTVTLTHSDVHLRRALFFQSLLEGWGVTWEDTRSRQAGKTLGATVYHLALGRYEAGSDQELQDFLTHVGSRLVFLIDWNRARKRLRQFLRDEDCVRVLRWAADHDVGHMGFLTLGGERLIFDALERTASLPALYGEPLSATLGRERTVALLCWILQTAATGLLAGQSRPLIRDEIEAELLRGFRLAHQDLIDVCADHASYIVEVAAALVEMLEDLAAGAAKDGVMRHAARAKAWERQGDELVSQVRFVAQRVPTADFYVCLLARSDDALDALEESCSRGALGHRWLTTPSVLSGLRGVADIALDAGRELVKALYAVQEIERAGPAGLMDDFLSAVDHVVDLERACDEARRGAEETAIGESAGYQELQLGLALAGTTEQATDALMKAALLVRDEVLRRGNL